VKLPGSASICLVGMSSVLTQAPYHTERIDGQEIEKPLPKKLHAIIQSYIMIAAAALLSRASYRVLAELNVLCGHDHQDRLVPDITIALRSATYLAGDLVDPAVLR
jgi:hypothetical protein